MSTDEANDNVLLYVQRLKAALGVKRDEELAAKLGLSKQAISNWRTRGAVPLRIQQQMLDQHGVRYADWDYTYEAAKGDIIYAVSLYAVQRYVRSAPQPDAKLWRSLGQVFPTVLRAVQQRLEGITAKPGSAETLISLLTLYLDSGQFAELDAILSQADPTD